MRRARCAPRNRRLASSTACCILEAVASCGEGGSLCYFVVSCTVRGGIDEIACPCAAFSGPEKFITFLTWSFETTVVGNHSPSMLFRKNCQNACANERDSIDEGSKVGEMPHPGGWRRSRGGLKRKDAASRGSWLAARARRLACMQKNRGRSMVSKKNRYRMLKRRLFV